MVRSLLYVPADSSRFIAGAHLRGADAIILDLEDAVLPAEKAEARSNLAKSVAGVGSHGARVFVRINSEINEAEADAKAAVDANAFGIYVPKADVGFLQGLDACLTVHEQGLQRDPVAFVALIEDAAALLDASGIAQQNRVFAMAVGGEDLANDLGARPDADVPKLPKQMVHFAAKTKGLMSFGTFRSVANYTDLDAIKAAAEQARRFGFDGASCVHPTVVPILNAAFQASGADVRWAAEVLDIARKSGAGSFAHDGMMIDAPVLERARRILVK